MKRVFAVIVLLCVAAAAYSVSGRLFMRFGAYKDGVTDTNYIGPMFSYWGPEAQNNVDLWQGKDGGTGFELNLDSFSLLYKTRDAIKLPGSLDSSNYSWQSRWGAQQGYASSPGYVQFRNIKLGKATMAAGLALWQLVGDKEKLDFDTNTFITNNNYKGSVAFVKGYVDFKIDLPINEYIKIKLEDWDLMFLEFFAGSSEFRGLEGGVSKTNLGGAGGFKIYLPPHLLLNLDRFQLDFSPRVIVDTATSNTTTTSLTNIWGDNYFRFGAYMRLTYNFTRNLAVYGMFGYFNESLQSINKENGTNKYYNTFNANVLPLFAGVKIMPTSAITLTLGYGINLMINNSWRKIISGATNYYETGTHIRTGYLNTTLNTYYNHTLTPERNTYGDTLMDTAFLRFGADFKIVGEWSFGMYSAVSLNDSWTWEWVNAGSHSESYYNPPDAGYFKVNNWLSFLNWMNYDQNMYLKFENDVFAAKLTFDAYARPASVDATILNLFGYMDFTYKF